MLSFVQTTMWILGWSFVLGSLWVFLLFAFFMRWPRFAARQRVGHHAVIPCLLLAPVLVAVVHRLLGFSLIYPTQFLAGRWSTIWYSLVPALTLLMGSGFFPAAISRVAYELTFWSQKPFATVATAYNLSPHRTLRKLVIGKSLVTCWGTCLPWVFGELVLVEAVFNAPGLGSNLWNLAKLRDFMAMALPLAMMAMIYALLAGLSALLHRRLGRRLDSYA